MNAIPNRHSPFLAESSHPTLLKMLDGTFPNAPLPMDDTSGKPQRTAALIGMHLGPKPSAQTAVSAIDSRFAYTICRTIVEEMTAGVLSWSGGRLCSWV